MSTDVTFIHHLLRPVIYLPKTEGETDIEPQIFELSDGPVWLAFSEVLKLARFFGAEMEFIELSPQAAMALAFERGLNLGFDIEDDYGRIMSPDEMRSLLDFLKAREELVAIEEFNFKSFELGAELKNALALIIPQHSKGYFLEDANMGQILVLSVRDNEFNSEAQLELRQNLLDVQQLNKISLLVLPEGDEKWQKLGSNWRGFAFEIERIEPKTPVQPPNLKAF